MKQQSSSPHLILGYWGLAGRNMPVLFLLEILEVPYQLQIFDQNLWERKEEELGLDFPNLPFLIDNQENVRITELHNIVNYILFKYGKGYNLLDLENNVIKVNDTFKIDEIRFLLNDIFTKISQTAIKFTPEMQMKQAQEMIVPKLEYLFKFIQDRNKLNSKPMFIMGYLSLADLYFYIIAKYFQKYFPTLCKDFKSIHIHLIDSFEEIPSINNFINSNRFPPLR